MSIAEKTGFPLDVFKLRDDMVSRPLGSQVTLEVLWKLRDGTTGGADLEGLKYFESDLATTVKCHIELLIQLGHLVPVQPPSTSSGKPLPS